MKGKILIADDETRIRTLVCDFLENEGYEVIEAKDGQQALDLFYANKDIKLMILDVMMPFFDGFQVVEELRPLSDTPILMLTARTAESDELRGFKLGVDDYIRKPFSPTILVARVNALFIREYGSEEVIEKGKISIRLTDKTITINNTPIELSAREYDLLYYLAENEGMILSRDQILYKVWGFDYEGTQRTVDTTMNRLRNKLSAAGDYIKTVRGYGYKFEANWKSYDSIKVNSN